MQFQVDAGDSRPTFFELVATDRLVPSLRAALVYSLRTLAERRPGVTRILDHEAEAFALLMLLVEAHSFATSDGSLAEGLYGLQRVRRLGARGGEEERGGSGGSGRRRGGRAAVARGGLLRSGDDDGGNGARRSRRISGKQRLLSVLVLVGLPYAREKLDALYVRLSGAVGAGSRGALGSTIAEAILGDHEPPGRSSRDEGARDEGARGEGARDEGARNADDDNARGGRRGRAPSSSSPPAVSSSSSVSGSIRAAAAAAFVRAYPWIHTGWEAVVFWCWLRYLLADGATHDPSLSTLRLAIVRASPSEMTNRRARVESIRASRLDRLSSSPSWMTRTVGAMALRAGHFALDHAQGGLMAAVVGFKLLEWWYGAAEDAVFRDRSHPPPPPPPRTAPHPRGCAVPRDPARCPLCRRRCSQPAVVRTSGWVFCHPCVADEVRRFGRCPVTLAAAAEGDVVRLFSE